jgi:hypothetical protein
MKIANLSIITNTDITLTAVRETSHGKIRGFTFTGTRIRCGSITFTGSSAQGSASLVSVYDIEYQGEYSVSGSNISVQLDQVWTGWFFADERMAGTWMDSDGQTMGGWEVKRE